MHRLTLNPLTTQQRQLLTLLLAAATLLLADKKVRRVAEQLCSDMETLESRSVPTDTSRASAPPEVPPGWIRLLTPRQCEIARLLLARQTYGEISKQLGISIETVRAHTKAAYRRLGVRSRDELRSIITARRRGGVVSRRASGRLHSHA